MSVLLRQPLPPSIRIEGPGVVAPSVPKLRRRERDRIWDLSTNLHCSVIGTCLTTGELRQLLSKLGESDAKTATSHAIHHRAVQSAGRGDLAGKLLNKLLDRKHETFVRRFGKAATRNEVAELWRAALEAGDIPGAYWATLTHPLTDDALVREAFGEVHMLSHLVGSSNRLDIARLRRLEDALADREETVARQQSRLHEKAALVREHEERIADLEREARQRTSVVPAPVPEERERADLLRRMQAAEARCARLETDLAEAREAERQASLLLEKAALREAELQRALACMEDIVTAPDEASPTLDFRDVTLLYVGGRPGQVDQVREVVRTRGGTLLTHDGGIENSLGLLPGLVARVDAVLFPVDCVSHGAVTVVKKQCRDMGKPLVPVRHASLGSFLAAATAFAHAGPCGEYATA